VNHILPHQWTIEQTITKLSQRECSAVELTQHFLKRIERHNPLLRAFIYVDAEHALEQAQTIDDKRAQMQALGPLAGVPIAVKDLFSVMNQPTTYGGQHAMTALAKSSAAVIVRLQQADAIIIGKTNLHEYAYGTTNENPHFGTSRNPWNRNKITGGSSGGSSIAVVAGLASAALGTDTGGSIRIPAALTGHVGLKPTYDLVSRSGVFPLAPSLDHVGPMTKNCADASLLLQVMAGADGDASSTSGYRYSIVKPKQPYRIGIPKRFFYDRCQQRVMQVIQSTLQKLERHSQFSFVEVDMPLIDSVPDMQNYTISCEAYAIHSEWISESPNLYGQDVRERLLQAAEVPGYKYVMAQTFREKFRQSVAHLFKNIDVLLTPTTPLVATDIGQPTFQVRSQQLVVKAHLTRYTNPWNLSGLPALSLPCGMSSDGLPVGLQLIAPQFEEQKLLSVGQAIEDELQWTVIAPDYRA